MDLGTSLWLSKKMDPVTRFHNAWVAYFMEQFLSVDAHGRYRGNVEFFYKAKVTQRNRFRGVVHVLSNYMYWPSDVRWEPSSQTERASESEYSQKKIPFKHHRGNASQKSMVLQTRLMHHKYFATITNARVHASVMHCACSYLAL